MSITTGYPATGLGLPWLINEANPSASLGQVIMGNDGAEYVYVKAGAATTIAAGFLYQTPAETTTHEDLAIAAAAIGATSLVTTTTATTVLNEYAGGYVVNTITPGLADRYRIAGNTAATGAVFTIYLEDPIRTALTTAARLDLTRNPYNGVIIQSVAGSLTGAPVGVAVTAITAGQYGWLQTKGVAAITNDANAAITVGQPLSVSASVAGAVRLSTAGSPTVAIASEGIAASVPGTANLVIS